jgi:hypothetical protein
MGMNPLQRRRKRNPRRPLRSPPAPAPQAESEAPAMEAALPEASIVEGEYTAQVQVSSRSSRSHQG